MQFYTGSTSDDSTARMMIDPQGQVGIGTFPSGTARLTVNAASVSAVRGESIQFAGIVGFSNSGTGVIAGSVSGDHFSALGPGGFLKFRVTNDGQICAANVSCASDARLKRDVTPLSYGLSELLRLHPVRWQWKDPTINQLPLGLVAQEVEPVLPELVLRGASEKEPLGLNYLGLVPVLVKGMQEQQEILERQQAENADLNGRIDALEKEASELKAKQSHFDTIAARFEALELRLNQPVQAKADHALGEEITRLEP